MDDNLDIVSFSLGAAASIIIFYLGYRNLTNVKNTLTTINTDSTVTKHKNLKKFKWAKISTIFGFLTWLMYLIQSLSHMATPIDSILESDSACDIHTYIKYVSYHWSKSCLDCLLISRARMAYVNSEYSYSLHKTIYPLYMLVFAFGVFTGIGDYFFVTSSWDNNKQLCVTQREEWGLIGTISLDVFFSILCLFLFIKPLFAIQSIGEVNTNTNTQHEHKLQLTEKSAFVIKKYTTLTAVALVSSLLFLTILGLVGKYYFVFFLSLLCVIINIFLFFASMHNSKYNCTYNTTYLRRYVYIPYLTFP